MAQGVKNHLRMVFKTARIECMPAPLPKKIVVSVMEAGKKRVVWSGTRYDAKNGWEGIAEAVGKNGK